MPRKQKQGNSLEQITVESYQNDFMDGDDDDNVMMEEYHRNEDEESGRNGVRYMPGISYVEQERKKIGRPRTKEVSGYVKTGIPRGRPRLYNTNDSYKDDLVDYICSRDYGLKVSSSAEKILWQLKCDDTVVYNFFKSMLGNVNNEDEESVVEEITLESLGIPDTDQLSDEEELEDSTDVVVKIDDDASSGESEDEFGNIRESDDSDDECEVKETEYEEIDLRNLRNIETVQDLLKIEVSKDKVFKGDLSTLVRKNVVIIWSEMMVSQWDDNYNWLLPENVPIIWIGGYPPNNHDVQQLIGPSVNDGEFIYIPFDVSVKRLSYDWLGRQIRIVSPGSGWVMINDNWGLWVSSWCGSTEPFVEIPDMESGLGIWLGRIGPHILPRKGEMSFREETYGSELIRWVDGELVGDAWIPLARWYDGWGRVRAWVNDEELLVEPLVGPKRWKIERTVIERWKEMRSWVFDYDVWSNWVKLEFPFITDRLLQRWWKYWMNNRLSYKFFRKFSRKEGRSLRIMRVDWRNLLGYEESGCWEPYDRLGGFIGLIAGSNRSGKSSLLDIFSFCLWEKTSRGNGSINILNKNRANGFARVEWIDNKGKRMRMERVVMRRGEMMIMTWCRWEHWVNGEWKTMMWNNRPCEGTRTSEWVPYLESHIGTMDDFWLLNVMHSSLGDAFISNISDSKRRSIYWKMMVDMDGTLEKAGIDNSAEKCTKLTKKMLQNMRIESMQSPENFSIDTDGTKEIDTAFQDTLSKNPSITKFPSSFNAMYRPYVYPSSNPNNTLDLGDMANIKPDLESTLNLDDMSNIDLLRIDNALNLDDRENMDPSLKNASYLKGVTKDIMDADSVANNYVSDDGTIHEINLDDFIRDSSFGSRKNKKKNDIDDARDEVLGTLCEDKIHMVYHNKKYLMGDDWMMKQYERVSMSMLSSADYRLGCIVKTMFQIDTNRFWILWEDMCNARDASFQKDLYQKLGKKFLSRTAYDLNYLGGDPVIRWRPPRKYMKTFQNENERKLWEHWISYGVHRVYYRYKMELFGIYTTEMLTKEWGMDVGVLGEKVRMLVNGQKLNIKTSSGWERWNIGYTIREILKWMRYQWGGVMWLDDWMDEVTDSMDKEKRKRFFANTFLHNRTRKWLISHNDEWKNRVQMLWWTRFPDLNQLDENTPESIPLETKQKQRQSRQRQSDSRASNRKTLFSSGTKKSNENIVYQVNFL